MAEPPEIKPPRWTRNAPLARYLNVSDMTIWRWKRNPALNFPPAAVINNVEYNDLNLIDEWMRSRIAHLVEETA